MNWVFCRARVSGCSMPRSYVPLTNPTKCVVHHGTEDDELVITGFKTTFLRAWCYRLLTIVSIGLVPLWIYWRPACERWRYKKCRLGDANVVSVEDASDNVTFCSIFCIQTEPDSTLDSLSSSEEDVNEKCSPRWSVLPRRVSSTTTEPVRGLRDICQDQSYIRLFVFRGLRFVFDQASNEFSLLHGLDGRVQCGELAGGYDGWTDSEQRLRRRVFGKNIIDVKVPSYWALFYKEVLNPFYMFQTCSLLLWSFDNYYIYAACVLLMSMVSIAFELYETGSQIRSLHDMVSTANETTVTIRRRDGDSEIVDSADLTPGDVVVVSGLTSDGLLFPCDAVLLNGSCVVDESILTGESAPIVKIPLTPNEAEEVFDAETHQKHVIFCGTRVIQTHVVTGGDLLCLVVRTGFSSTKGSLIRSVLYPKAIGFEFYRDSMLFLIILALVAVAGTIYSMAVFIIRGMHIKKVLTDSLDIITIVVPPTLPAAMAVGVWYSQRRLKWKGIYSTSPHRINLCGKLNLVCFDKTGTLTEEGLELNGIISCQHATFGRMVEDLSTLGFGPVLSCLVTCHNLASVNGNLIGEALDLRIFQSTRWVMEVPTDTDNVSSFAPTVVKPAQWPDTDSSSVEDLIKFPPLELGILRQFPFSPALQRCTVIARRLGNYPMAVYCKGAPEKIAALCRRETIPSNFGDVVDRETMLGHRVLALAFRTLPKRTLWHHLQRMKREDLEKEMEFLGVVIFRNRLKEPTTMVIDELKRAKIRCVMVTGDNLLTSLCVARECHMISGYDQVRIVTTNPESSENDPELRLNFKRYPESMNVKEESSYQNDFSIVDDVGGSVGLAISGPDFAVIREKSPDILKRIISSGVVLARMRPEQKAQLVEAFQELGYIVGMCGDGANDCSALKAAHAGLSLSDLEASVAAPFTCRVQTIECIPELIKEGRCALVTSFGVFKYMTMYSMIQFVSVLILYSMNLFFADYMYLFIDLFIITVVAILMGRTEAYNKLDRKQPSAKLLSYTTTLSLVTHLIILIAVQLLAILYLRSRIWYAPVHPDPNDEMSFSWETTTIFFVSCYQYLIMAVVLSSGPPYRRPFYTNYPFAISLILFTMAITACLFIRISFIDSWLELVPIPLTMWRFQLSLFLLALLNLAISAVVELTFSKLSETVRPEKLRGCTVKRNYHSSFP